MGFLENVYGFLFQPYDQCKRFSEDETTKKFTKTSLLVLYSGVILGVVLIFWILYPERIYYGVPLDAPLKMLFRISVSEPNLFLIVIGLALFLVVILNFLLIGCSNYVVAGLLSKKKLSGKQMRDYLSIYGYTSTLPLLLLGTVTVFWVYFIEKFNLTTEIPPFFDWNLINTIFFIILFGFLAWKWISEFRINQAFFDISIWRAIVPELIQIGVFFGFLMLVGYIGSIFAGDILGVV